MYILYQINLFCSVNEVLSSLELYVLLLSYLLNLVHLKQNMADTVLRFFAVEETASGNVVFVVKYIKVGVIEVIANID